MFKKIISAILDCFNGPKWVLVQKFEVNKDSLSSDELANKLVSLIGQNIREINVSLENDFLMPEVPDKEVSSPHGLLLHFIAGGGRWGPTANALEVSRAEWRRDRGPIFFRVRLIVERIPYLPEIVVSPV